MAAHRLQPAPARPIAHARAGGSALAVLLLGALALSGASCRRAAPGRDGGGAAAGTRAPNVILISIDALRADHLSASGYPRETSPRIDELARRGARFDRAFAQGAWTFSAVPSLATSRFPQDHADFWLEAEGAPGFGASRLAPDAPTIGQILARSGHATGLLGGHPGFRMMVGLRRGFGTFEPDLGDAAQVTDRALAWIGDHARAPFFLWIHYFDPHAPYTPPPPFDTRFDDGRLATGRTLPSLANHYLGAGGIPTSAALEGHRELDHYVARYDGEIAYVDSQIGRLLDALRERGLEDHTVVVVTADHGEALGEQDLYFSHRGLHAAVVHIPLVIALPERPPARVVETPVMAVDVLPTIAELVGAPVRDPRWVGRSLAACARGGACPPAEAYSTSGLEVSLRVAGLSLLCPSSLANCRLYDTTADPLEARNVAAERPEVVAELRARLERWVRAHPDARPRSEAGFVYDDPEMKTTLRSLGYIR